MNRDDVKSRFNEVLGKRAPQFISSMISLSNGKLKKCDAKSVIASCMVAATLDLPINSELGLAHLVPYAGKAQFQIGYKGLTQLAIRSGQYRHLNTCCVYQGQLKSFNKLTGELELDQDVEDSGEAVGYAAYLETVSGYSHAVYWTRQQVEKHALRFSQAFKKEKKDSPWFTDFDSMAQKTVLKHLIGRWGPMSVDVQTAVRFDQSTQASIGGEPMFDDALDVEQIEDDSEKGIESLGPVKGATTKEEEASL